MPNGYDFVLFDLGGVLVRLGGVAALQELAGIDSEAEVWSRWLTCAWVRDFERGRCSDREFSAGMVVDWGLPVSPGAFLEMFERWPEDLFEGTADLVAAVREQVHVGCASNSNTLHWERMTSLWGFGSLFDATFLSHELGLIKPDRDFFDHIVSAIGLPPARLMFLDDNKVNVVQARAAGLTAARVRGADEARSALVDIGVVPR